MNPDNLVFGFSIPRSADPQSVFAVMFNAVKYCQKRLGGKILDGNLKPFNENAAKEELKSLIAEMKNKGIDPGSNKAMMTY
jgi:cell division protein ZipA